MSAIPRESSFMPTVKCSSCGLQVEISLMGEHICGRSDAQSTPQASGPPSFDAFMPEKLPRVMPPSLDTSAANRPFVGQGQLTPVSLSSGSRGESPKTPNGRFGPGRPDDYFSPRIASDSPPGQSMRRPGGYGGFGEPDGADVEPIYPGTSPKKPATNVLQRMNTIAPGPFEAGRRPSAPRNALPARNATEDYDRPGTSMSNLSSSVGSMRGAPRAPRKNGYGGFGPPSRGNEEPEPKPFGLTQRSDTFPRPSDPVDTPARTPSAPGPRPDRWRRPSDETAEPMPMTGDRMRRPSKDTSRPPPPRTSLVRSKTSPRDGSSSSNGSVNIAVEFGIGNPYHTPSDSMSSSVSGYSQPSAQPSQPSSRSSPSRSAASSFDRKPSDTAGLDSVTANLRPPVDNQRPKEMPRSPAQASFGDKPFAKTLAKRPPPPQAGYDPRIDPRPRRAPSPLASPTVDMSTRDDPAIQNPRPNRFAESPAAPPTPVTSSPERPMTRARSLARPPPQDDPAIQQPRSRSRARDPAPAPIPAPVPAPTTIAEPRSRSRSPGEQPPVSTPMPPPPPPPSSSSSSRGDCKSCGQAITTGKSISSADGRLTGRYHKACFVCATCREPFSSAEFYVLGDRPYCRGHYHELNGSLCGGCGDGIEGQYVEDESGRKYHPGGCFRCGDCGVGLTDGYFEVGGRAYCEKDAWRRVQQPPPRMAGPGGRKGSAPSGLTLGLPTGGPRTGNGNLGLPSGNNRMGSGFVPRPRMEKRMTRLGMM